MDRISQMVHLLQNYYTTITIIQLKQRERFRMNPTQSMGEYRKTIKNYSYFLNDVIGKGYSSTVYTGLNDQNGDKVAIKVIELKFIKDQVTRKLLQTELECIKKIKHRNLLRFIQSYQTSNNLYIITEYCEGGDLQKQLKSKGRFTEAQLVTFFAQFYAGYTSLLESGFIHRDIKPANILIRKGKIRIADFGIVKKISENPKDKYSVGTLLYMSPQSLSSNIFTQKSDVWSIGIMCYQLVHGKFPWKANQADKQAIMNEVLNSTITFDSGWLSVECIKFINQCLDRNPNTRISIKDMMNHPWMKNVITLIKPQRSHSNAQNLNNPSHIKQEQMIRQPLQSQRSKNLSLKNIPSLETNKKSTSLTNINTKANFSQSIESPIKSPTLKFLYKNQNNLNAENQSQSPFQKMRFRILGNPTQFKLNILTPNFEIRQKTSKVQVEIEINNFVTSIFNYSLKIYRMMEMIKENRLVAEGMRSQTYLVLLVQFIRCLRDQEIMVKLGENVYGVTGWELYRNGNKWKDYASQVIEFLTRNKERYENQLNMRGVRYQIFQYVKQRRFSTSLKPILENLRQIIQKRLQSEQNMSLQDFEQQQIWLIKVFDKLISLYQFEEVLFYKGWQYLKNNFQMGMMDKQGDSEIRIDNYREIWQLLQVKIQIIFQS